MVLSSTFLEAMPQRVPTGELSPAPEDYTAVFAADAFDLSLLPNTQFSKEVDFGFGLWSPIKQEPLSEEESESCDQILPVGRLEDNLPDHKLLREVLKDTSFQKRYNLIPVPVGELGTGFRAEMEEVSMDLAQEEIQPVLSMAMEQLKTEIHSTCAVLGISREPCKWTVEEVETWLAWNLAQFSLPMAAVQFFKMPGQTLTSLSEQDFIERSSEVGGLLYAQLELWRAASVEGTKVDDSGFLQETSTTRSGSSSGDPSDDEEDEEMTDASQASPKSSSSKSGSGGSHIHLWQFLKELLASPAIYGNCIRWLDRQAGVFKIEDSVRVARLWGKRKNRPAMNYDKLSRSIRQYYKKGIMKKTERSQRLVYQFCHPYSL
ncbi:Ets-domain [Nesidiocoris tenuis]|uniref:Ets-domain n=1 Tax=Nesidiocoris tenuis TaxID=355587 RepID=A0ABN7BAR2_9HEMI|nr:Ets-domain [Nesidiocoris tenuis]